MQQNKIKNAETSSQKKYFIYSLSLHALILCVLIFNLDIATPLPVFENTNKQDVISAVILGDVSTSKIIKTPSPPVTPQKALPAKAIEPPKIMKDVIALKVLDKKKLQAKKALQEKQHRELLAKNLMDDINKIKKKQQQIKPQKLQTTFQKHLKEQAEKSLRQQLLNEKIKLQATEAREAQGEVNKYKALIIQAIGEQWLVPPQANKNLYCELMIRVAPGGMVLDVQVTKSSGDTALDSSARAAVLKASPLPVPDDADAFAAFRQFVLKVKPESVSG